MTKFLSSLGLILSLTATVSAQFQETPSIRDYDPAIEEVYAVKPWLETGVGVAGLGLTVLAFQKINDKDKVELEGLNRADIPSYDRWALPKDGSKASAAADASDYVFNSSIVLPFTLFLDKEIRKDWGKITAMYVEAQAVNGLMYAVSPIGPSFIDRTRPIAYYDDLDRTTRRDGGNQNSFFSGHVSTTAVGTFFFAKVLSDYHPEWSGKQRAMAFTAASLPPLYVAVQRVRALKHFPTDTAVGLGVGAAIGVLTPHIHKRWQRNHRSSLTIGGSFGGGAAGAGFSLVF
ncbi:phosphatase PAP2 family protein [Lewinella sp. 4G2]|uniref:phosphatase PAP2 family protein n=1 Tax=Lewinella sp. 4G2 TaxID=1803372 RepID=UPI0007B4DFCF|nr:phosphatase PAP2 family protein [Lewinella sp. 4G2]OAV43349.1 hypothetical protein A3850_002045 [Lewinella sp. 4G2]